MPIYTESFPTDVTLCNDIKSDNTNPYVEPVLTEDSVWIEQTKYLGVPLNLPDGEGENYRRPYYGDVFSAKTTAGYTNMQQVTFTRHTGMITGYQWGVPTI